MRIPKSTVNPRWYVALSLEEAYSSWGSLLEAHASIGRFEETDPARRKIQGIVENGPDGPRFVFITRFPVNEHDEWVGLDTERPLLRSEIVHMARRQLAMRDRWLAEMPNLCSQDIKDARTVRLVENAEQYALAEKLLTEWGDLFPEELVN